MPATRAWRARDQLVDFNLHEKESDYHQKTETTFNPRAHISTL
jgi:hypothetical protein